jgi:hypothetical protein
MNYRSFASMSAGIISGIVHVLKSGGRIDAPDIRGPRKTLYTRFVRWAAMSAAVLASTLTRNFSEPLHTNWP